MPCEWLHGCSAAAVSGAVGPAYRYAQGGQSTAVEGREENWSPSAAHGTSVLQHQARETFARNGSQAQECRVC